MVQRRGVKPGSRGAIVQTSEAEEEIELPEAGSVGSDDLRDLRHQRIYIEGRLPDIDREMRGLAEERQSINASLQGGEDVGDVKALKHRRIFIRTRTEKLRGEKQELSTQIREIREKLRSSRSEKAEEI